MLLRNIFLVFFFAFAFISKAQYSSVENITTKNGLSQNDVTCIMQDSYGFMWFGTHDGINRFDGKTFKKYYKGNHALSSGIINKIVEDKNKNLWVATMDNGITRLNLKTGKVEEYFRQDAGSNLILENRVDDIVCDSSGVIWYTTEYGVGKIYKENGNYIVKDILKLEKSALQSAKFKIDKDHRIWLMGQSLLRRIENDEVIIVKEDKSGIYLDFVEYSNKIIIASSWRIWQINGGDILGRKRVVHSGAKVLATSLIIDYDGNLWIGTRYGLYKYKYENQRGKFVLDENFESEKEGLGLASIDIRSLYKDKTGIIYIGTYGDGVKKFNSKGKKFRHYLARKDNIVDKIRSVYQDSDNRIYIGDHKGKVFVLNDYDWIRNENFYSDSLRVSSSVVCIEEIFHGNNKKTIIAGGDYAHSLHLLAGDPIQLPDITANVFCITQAKDGLVWIGSYGRGLFRWDPSGKIPFKSFTLIADKTTSITSNVIRSICFDEEARLWVGTDDGISILTKDEQIKDNPSFVQIKNDPSNPRSLSYNYVLGIIKGKNGELWVGTMGEGVNRLMSYNNGKAEFEIFNTEDGIINNVIRTMIEDDYGNLWISSNRGISMLNPTTKKIENYDVANGLQDYEFSDLAGCKLEDGMLMFGGVNGINAFYPMEIKQDWSKAIPVFTKLSVLNRDVWVGDTVSNAVILKEDINVLDNIRVKYQDNSFAIKFASLHYAHPEKNMCKYKLEGFDSDWTEELSGNHAKYTNLSPGKYTFKLMAANGDGIWSENVKELTIVIEPPFLLTNYMLVVYVLILFLLLVFFRKFSIINIKRKHELSIIELEKRKEQEVNQMKLQFFMNISHEFKTPLTLIVNPLEQILSKGFEPTYSKLKNYHEVMYRNAQTLLKLINQLMGFRKIEQGMMKLNIMEGNIKAFLKDIHESFSSVAFNKEIKFNFGIHCLVDKLWIDYDKLEKVLNNILSNAFKYTEEGGEISLELLDDNSEYITIIISDNGEGIPDEAHNDIYNRYFTVDPSHSKLQMGTGIGLAYTKSLVELMQGKIEFKSKPNEGTVFFIKLPKDKSVFNNELIISKELINNQADHTKYENQLLNFSNVINDEEKLKNDQLSSILIVEDNKDLCSFLSDSFSDKYNVYIAHNGKDGIEKSKEILPDIIITDVAMPLMNGIDMTKELKKTLETSHIPIIMLTAHDTDQQHAEGLNIGADIYMGKPFNIQLLSAQIVSLLKNRQALRLKFKDKIELMPSEISPSNKDEKLLKKLLGIVEENISNPDFSVVKLAEECGFSSSTLNSKLKALTGLQTKKFIRTMRIKRACQLLKEGHLSVSEVTYDVGFNDLRYFRECFTAEVGCLPSEYKSKYLNELTDSNE